MAKILCSYSGLQFRCEHMPLSLSDHETAHPTFFLPAKKLAGLYSLYLDGKLSVEEEWLLFLAYLKSSGCVEFRVPAKFTANTRALIATQFEQLVAVVTKVSSLRAGSRIVPAKVAITPATATLENLPHWLALWEQTYQDYLAGFDAHQKITELAEIEERLLRLQGQRAPSSQGRYNSLLADWAAKAFDFPQFLIQDAGKPTTLSNYWRLIIRSCQSGERIFQFPRQDIQELYDHCCERIEGQPQWGIDTLQLISYGLELHSDFLGLGDPDLAGKPISFTLIDGEQHTADAVQQANLAAIIAAAPKTCPRREDYPTEFAYMKAKVNWQLANKNGATKPAAPANPNSGSVL